MNYRYKLISRSHTVDGVSIRSYEPLNAHRRVDAEELLIRISDEMCDGDVMYDIGANVGTHSLVLGKKYDISIKCFEPNPEVYRWLVANVRANSCDNIDTYWTGLSDRDGVHELQLAHRKSTFEDRGRNGSRTAEVPVYRLDTLVGDDLSPPDRIKIDVEGHELSVLDGARETLCEYEPTIYVESHGNSDMIRAFLTDIGYRIERLPPYMVARS
nr:FkbM family methyltransferase [Natronococcus pandeyae]